MDNISESYDGWRRWRLEQRRIRREKAELSKKNKTTSRFSLFGFLKALFSGMLTARNVKEKIDVTEHNSGNS